MSNGVKGTSASNIRVSISSGVKKTIETIKEITGHNHTEDEIYAVLKECSMDPNETTQKLLLLDTFHEVKRKRDRKKENMTKESVESNRKAGIQSRAIKGNRGNYSLRYKSDDVGGGRNSAAAKESATDPVLGSKAPLATAQEVQKNGNSLVASPITAISNGSIGITAHSANVLHDNHASASGGVNHFNAAGIVSTRKSEGPLPLSSSVDSITIPNALGTRHIQQHQMLDSSKVATPVPPAPASGSYLSSSDPILLPSQDLPLDSALGTIQREVGSQGTPVEPLADNPVETKLSSASIASSEVGSSILQQKMPNDVQGVGNNRPLESLQPASYAAGVSTINRPSSNNNNRAQVIGLQKGPGKEWKPKFMTPSIGQIAPTAASSEVLTVSVGSQTEPVPAPVALTLKEDTVGLQREFEELHMSDRHVIIPNHLHVPDPEKLGFCFGSFDASFGLHISHNGGLGSHKSPQSSDFSEAMGEPVKELELSNQNPSVAEEATDIENSNQHQSPSQEPEKLSSSEVEVASSITPEHNEAKQEVAPETHEHLVAHMSSNFNFGLIPPTLSGQLTPLENSETSAHDAPRLPSFVVPQSFDPASYYAQFYHSGMDNNGRISPFHSAGAAINYGGDAALVSPQTSQCPQELQGGVPLVLSTASPTPVVTQAAGVMQSSITTQQPLPVFRQPTGVHLPHYPPNFMPYGPYFSPFYFQQPGIHQFLSNGTFSQQPMAGNLYPTPPGATTKYPVSQYKQGSNSGNPSHIGVPGSYVPYGLSMCDYHSNPATAAATSPSNGDIAAPQVKENNIYVSGQQTEGSGVWLTTPSRDISALQASSFYNLPQGQLAFNPTQPGHGTFAGIFHPAQAVPAASVHPLLQQSQALTSPVDMMGPTAARVYQPHHHTQLNWPSNY